MEEEVDLFGNNVYISEEDRASLYNGERLLYSSPFHIEIIQFNWNHRDFFSFECTLMHIYIYTYKSFSYTSHCLQHSLRQSLENIPNWMPYYTDWVIPETSSTWKPWTREASVPWLRYSSIYARTYRQT